MVVVYADMCADLFHYGHVRFLRAAKSIGQKLIVGIHSDADIEVYKRKPVLSMWERIEVVRACRYVDIVVENAPLQPDKSFVENHGIHVICHGDDITSDKLEYFYGDVSNLVNFKLVKYTAGISTSEIIRRVKNLTKQEQ